MAILGDLDLIERDPNAPTLADRLRAHRRGVAALLWALAPALYAASVATGQPPLRSLLAVLPVVAGALVAGARGRPRAHPGAAAAADAAIPAQRSATRSAVPAR